MCSQRRSELLRFCQSELQTTHRAAPIGGGTVVECGRPPVSSTLPPCGLKGYLLHRDRLVIQTVEPAGCGEGGGGLWDCIYLPWEKYTRRFHGEMQHGKFFAFELM